MVSARHHLTDRDRDAWGGLGHETAPRAACANHGCTKSAREHLGDFDEYCSNRCAREHLGACKAPDCNRIAAPVAYRLGGYCSRACADVETDYGDW